MASYVENSLINDEKIIYTAQISLWSMTWTIVFGGFMVLVGLINIAGGVGGPSAVFLVIGCVLLLMAYITLKTTELAITNKRIIAKFGFIRRKTIELNTNRVESMQVEQGILGRMLNFGSLVIAGAGTPQAPIPGISNPLAFRKAFMALQDSTTKA